MKRAFFLQTSIADTAEDVVIARKVISSARKTKPRHRPTVQPTVHVFDSDDDFQWFYGISDGTDGCVEEFKLVISDVGSTFYILILF